jgi:hypothetical protein
VAEHSADDFVFIKARLKEIQAEREKAIQGTAEEPAKPSTVTGSGGFTTPAGQAYDPYCC